MSLIKLLFIMVLSMSLSYADGNVSVKITEDIPYVDVTVQGKKVRIQRVQDKNNRLRNNYAKTSRECPPFCIHPMRVSEGVKTVGTLEVLKFLQDEVNKKRGLLVDARMPQWYKRGTVPGALNLPFTLVTGGIEDPYMRKIVQLLGGRLSKEGKWNFDRVKKLTFIDNGPWCDQSTSAIKGLLEAGYPAEKIFYYRGGMQDWQVLGLTIIIPEA
jgi:rhodanese-related sulfurtransferase